MESTAGKTPTAAGAPVAPSAAPAPMHFIRAIVADDVSQGCNGGKVHTRFPPEPNGYLHIGHAKAICLDFGMANEFGGVCNLRMDDTNPSREEVEYVDSIQEDVRWLGFNWSGAVRYASDYFGQTCLYAEELIKIGKAYVCDLSAEEMKGHRGTLTEPGKESPYRTRSVDENLDLFRRMRAGEFPDGSRVLRAKIDMFSPNIHMRDPVIYRILRAMHHRTGDAWCIYPMYDFAHPIGDAMEGITHSICTLEFEIHRPLYDWVLDQVPGYFPSRPHQYEFARLNLSYTIMSKRKLLQLAQEGLVSGWDDPRMPTICGMRRRGYTPEAIRNFCELIGVTKYNSLTDVALLEHCLREDLNKRSPRVMGVLHPLKVVIDNYPAEQVEEMDAINNPEDPAMGSRKVPFSKVLYIEQDDFREEPPKKFFRLAPGREVRLRYAYFVTCTGVVKNDKGEVVELHCTYDPATRGGNSPDGRKVQGTIHWVSAAHAVTAEVRLYDRLFTVENPGAEEGGKSFKESLNPAALTVLKDCRLEPSLNDVAPGSRCQFERLGYFCADLRDSRPGALVFNQTITLKDSWAKLESKGKG